MLSTQVPVLALGALSTAVIDQALDLVRDFKTAHLLGAPPKAVFAAQCVGAAASVFSAAVLYRAAQESEIPNFKGSYLGRFPLVSADLWTSDHLLERSRSVDAFSGTRARGT